MMYGFRLSKTLALYVRAKVNKVLLDLVPDVFFPLIDLYPEAFYNNSQQYIHSQKRVSKTTFMD